MSWVDHDIEERIGRPPPSPTPPLCRLETRGAAAHISAAAGAAPTPAAAASPSPSRAGRASSRSPSASCAADLVRRVQRRGSTGGGVGGVVPPPVVPASPALSASGVPAAATAASEGGDDVAAQFLHAMRRGDAVHCRRECREWLAACAFLLPASAASPAPSPTASSSGGAGTAGSSRLLNGVLFAEVAAHCTALVADGDTPAVFKRLLATPPRGVNDTRALFQAVHAALPARGGCRVPVAAFDSVVEDVLLGDVATAWRLLWFTVRSFPPAVVARVRASRVRSGSVFRGYARPSAADAAEEAVVCFLHAHGVLRAYAEPSSARAETLEPTETRCCRGPAPYAHPPRVLAAPYVLPFVRNGMLLAELAEAVFGDAAADAASAASAAPLGGARLRVLGLTAHPRVKTACVANIVRVQGALRTRRDMSPVYLDAAAAEAVYEGNASVILPLLEDVMRCIDGYPARRHLVRPGDEPYVRGQWQQRHRRRVVEAQEEAEEEEEQRQQCEQQQRHSQTQPPQQPRRRRAVPVAHDHRQGPEATAAPSAPQSTGMGVATPTTAAAATPPRRPGSASRSAAAAASVERTQPQPSPRATATTARSRSLSNSSAARGRRLSQPPTPQQQQQRTPSRDVSFTSSSAVAASPSRATPSLTAAAAATPRQPQPQHATPRHRSSSTGGGGAAAVSRTRSASIPVVPPLGHTVATATTTLFADPGQPPQAAADGPGPSAELRAAHRWVRGLLGVGVLAAGGALTASVCDGTLLADLFQKVEHDHRPMAGIVRDARKAAQRRHNVKKVVAQLNERRSLIDRMRETEDDVCEAVVDGDPAMVARLLLGIRRAYGHTKGHAAGGSSAAAQQREAAVLRAAEGMTVLRTAPQHRQVPRATDVVAAAAATPTPLAASQHVQQGGALRGSRQQAQQPKRPVESVSDLHPHKCRR